LLALATMCRGSEIQAFSVDTDHCRSANGGVTLSYNSAFLAKNERANVIHKDAFIPTIRSAAHDESRSWCPVLLLQEYIKTTRDLRPKDSSQLFIITKPPFSPATKATIARWITSVIETCYKAAHVDLPSTPKAHQV
jgi:hypothetical protein